MRVERLQLEGFRNIASLEFEPGGSTNVIWGDNAQGKTNLLEAIWLFTGAKSFRGARDCEYLPFGAPAELSDQKPAALELHFSARGREQQAQIRYGASGKRVFLNGVRLDGTGALGGEFCAVVFSPDHLELIKQGPGKRRRMLDISLCQAYPKYRKILTHYEQALKQRTSLLRDISHHPELLDMLDVWDGEYIRYGAYIVWMRARYTARLVEYAREIYDGISSGREDFGALYRPGFEGVSHGTDREEVTRLLAQAVRASRAEDIRQGVSLIGPHRDDLEVLVGGNSARAFASQGQQRSCVLALKLAECAILQHGCGEPPVILLDDVMSELDEGRRNYLLSRLDGRQVFLTCCDHSLFSKLDGEAYRIRAGTFVDSPPEYV